jgi:uncharacterized protein
VIGTARLISTLVEPDDVEIRVLGCLIEKQRTTPDAYPLTLNSLRLACNQSTNRAPVVDYDEPAIRGALERLGKRGWTRMATWSSGRTKKYRHLLNEALSLDDAEIAVLAVLMLRGPQTPGELNQRTDRLHGFEGPAEIEATLDRLIDRELVARLPRRPGERGQRFAHLLGGAGEGMGAAPAPSAPAASEAPASAPPAPAPAAPAADGALGDRLDRLEAEVRELRDELRSLREELGA